MKTTPTRQDLDTALRQGAQARRELLAAQPYPIGDYPPRRAAAAMPPRPNVVWRAAQTLGLTAALTTGLLLALNWVGQFVAAPPADVVAESPEPGEIIGAVRALAAQIDRAERELGREFDPALTLATGWPVQVQALGDSLRQPTTLPAPMQEELVAFRHDLLAAADYVRAQWKATPGDGLTPAPPAQSTPPGDAATPTGRFPTPSDTILGVAAG